MISRFTLRSTELRQPVTLSCKFLRRVDDGGVPDKILVEVKPPLPGHLYCSKIDLDQLVLAPRHKGAVLYPAISGWPCSVHICVPEEAGTWDLGPFRIADWGVIEQGNDPSTARK